LLDPDNRKKMLVNCSRSYTVFRIEKNIRPKYVDIDTSIIISRLMSDQKGHYSTKGNKIKLSNEIWNKFFLMDHRVFRKGYKDDIYIDDIPEDKLKKLRKDKLIGIDPGLSDIIFCTDGHIEQVQKPNGKVYRRTRTFQYSNGQRKSDMKSKIYANKIEEDKKQTIFHGKTVKDIETILSRINSSSCQWDTVIVYTQIRNLINDILLTYYEQVMFRKFNWYSFINQQRSEADMMNRFEKIFGSPDNATILMGDFSRKTSMKYCEPTKGKSIRKLFKDRGYRLYLVNEYNTSCKLYETGEELAKIRKDKDGRYVHRLLGSKILKRSIARENMGLSKDPFIVYHMECGYRPTIIHRDLNGSLNIRYKGWCIVNGFEIPEYMKRSKQEEPEMAPETVTLKQSSKCTSVKPRSLRVKRSTKNCSIKQVERSAKVRYIN
jgi:hypothetical protein